MWLSLDPDLQYRFEDGISPVAFFQHLPHLLAPTDTLVLGCYEARPDIRRSRTLRCGRRPGEWPHRVRFSRSRGPQNAAISYAAK